MKGSFKTWPARHWKLAWAGAIASVGLPAAMLLTGCSSVQPSIGQYAIVTGHGPFSNQQVKDVVAPGNKIHVSSNDVTWYIPAQVRNFVTSPAGKADRTQGLAAKTASDKTGPGMPVYTYSYIAWQINPAIVKQANQGYVDKGFFPFCLKYGCATQQEQTSSDTANLSRSSYPGWLNMVDEVFPTAVDNATRDALASYGPALWNDQSQWAGFGDKIAQYLPQELQKIDGSPSQFQYFCGPGSTEDHCGSFTVLIKNVVPVDSTVISAYDQQITAEYQQKASAARMAVARELYGAADAGWFQGMKDLIAECAQDHVTCNIYAGNAPVHP
jgi:hypothetical protein